MKVTIGRDGFRCDTMEEYKRCIENVFLYKDAEIWISELGTRDDFPCLGVLVNESHSVVHYFEKDKCFVTVGKTERADMISFCNGAYDICGYQAVTRDETKKVVLEFYQRKKLPVSMEWEEL